MNAARCSLLAQSRNSKLSRECPLSANSGHWPALTLIGWVAKPEGLRADSDRLGFHRLSPRQLIA